MREKLQSGGFLNSRRTANLRGCGAYGRKETAFDDQHHRFIEGLSVPSLSPASISEYVNDFGLALDMHSSTNVALFMDCPANVNSCVRHCSKRKVSDNLISSGLQYFYNRYRSGS